MTNTNYLIVNPAAANVYFNTAGTALSSTIQPVVNAGSAKGLASNRTLLDNVAHGFPFRVHGSQVVGALHVGSAFWGSAVGSVTVAASSGYARFSKTSHGLVVGDFVNITDTNSIVDGVVRVTAVPTANAFDTSMPYVSGAGTVDYKPLARNFATMTAEQYIMRRVTTLVAGTAETVLLSGGSDYGIRRSIHKVETSMRHLKVATAIRAGYWDIFNGVFTTAPTNSNDSIGNVAGSTITNGTADHAATPTLAVPGELVYKEPKPLPVQDDYPAKNN